jgi:GTP-binding protein EngB required for normal cell division
MNVGQLIRNVFGKSKPNDGALESVVTELRRRKEELDSASVRLGLIGETGAGKSSLINALLGRPVAREGVVPTGHAVEGEEHTVEGLTLVDLPGFGAIERPLKSYVADLKLLEPGRYDGFVLVTANRLKEGDRDLYQALHRDGGKPFFLVRSHFDLAVRTAGEAEARRQIEEYFRRHLGDGVRVYMVAAPHPSLYDLPALIHDLGASLSELKRVRLLTVVPGYTQELVREKREAAEHLVLAYAGLAAANGLNPIPGTDILLDLGLMQQMTRKVISACGLRRDQLERLERLQVRGLTLDFMLDAASTVLTRLAESGVIALVKQAGKAATQEAGRQAAQQGGKYFFKYAVKLAPLVGQVVAAAVGGTTAYFYGKFLLDECEEALLKIVQRVDVLP